MAYRTGNKGIFKLTYPRTPPYNNTGDYLHSKATLSRLQFRNYEWDKPRHDPELHLTAGRRIFEATKEALSNKREWAKHEHLKLEAQWEDLYEKEEKLKDTFVKLSQFIRSNQDKRRRAEQIRQEDYILRMQRTKEIERLQQKIALVVESKKEMDANICSLKMYEQYLNQVVSASEDFKNADDLIMRYEALVNTRNILGRRQDENLRELEMARAKTARMAEENSFKILGLNNMVADLNSRYNTAFREALHWENIVLAIKSNSFEKYQEINEVRRSCWNMYLLMCKRKSEVPKISEDDFEQQLLYIKKTLQELATVKELAAQGKFHLTEKARPKWKKPVQPS
ncbi:coiled-coil domain-containing protein 42 like-2-like [Tenebrio molitor]|uniref:coiled-coil domain-containing protein 42 like-2-like n=1 Tax=Tenebrio molitor TaxID=7067 RepID=UPI003624A8CB